MSQNDALNPQAESLTYEVGTSERFSEAVVAAVATVSGDDPIAPSDAGDSARLPSLYSAIDPDALDAIFGRTEDETPRGGGQVNFRYHGYDVTVHGHGIVRVTPSRDGERRPSAE